MYLDILLRGFTILLFIARLVIWRISGVKANRQKTKTKPLTIRGYISKLILNVLGLFLIIQLFGVQIFPIEKYGLILQLFGCFLVILGTIICLAGRIYLGSNWTHGYDLQIKIEHELVTSGIYSYIRHPIYTGIVLSMTGSELVAKSYLFILIFLIYFLHDLWQAKREEKLLSNYFGAKYKSYAKKTKMFIPFIY